MIEQGVQQQGHKSEGPDPDEVTTAVYYQGEALVARLVRRHGYTAVSQWVSNAQYQIGQEEESERRTKREAEIRQLEEVVRAGEEARRKLLGMK